MKALAIYASILWMCTALLSAALWVELRAARDEVAVMAATRPNAASNEPKPVTDKFLPRMESAVAPSAVKDCSAPEIPRRGAELKMLGDPEFLEGKRREMRLSIPELYPGLASELRLSPGEANQLFDLLANQMVDQMQNDLGPDGTRNAGEFRSAQQRQTADIANLLGSRYPEFENYNQTRPTRLQVAQMQRSLQAVGQGLSEEQFHDLTGLALAERKKLDDELLDSRYGSLPLTQGEERRIRLISESNERLLLTLRGKLSATQYGAVRTVLESRVTAIRANLRMQAPPVPNTSAMSP
jgi:hypothetical protein